MAKSKILKATEVKAILKANIALDSTIVERTAYEVNNMGGVFASLDSKELKAIVEYMVTREVCATGNRYATNVSEITKKVADLLDIDKAWVIIHLNENTRLGDASNVYQYCGMICVSERNPYAKSLLRKAEKAIAIAEEEAIRKEEEEAAKAEEAIALEAKKEEGKAILALAKECEEMAHINITEGVDADVLVDQTISTFRYLAQEGMVTSTFANRHEQALKALGFGFNTADYCSEMTYIITDGREYTFEEAQAIYVLNGKVFAHDTIVVANDNGRKTNLVSVKVERCMVSAYGCAHVWASDQSTVYAHEMAMVTLYDSSCHAYDESYISAHGKSTVTAGGTSIVRTYGEAEIVIWQTERANIRIGRNTMGIVFAHDVDHVDNSLMADVDIIKSSIVKVF